MFMKKYMVLLLTFMLCDAVFSASINPYVYKTMSTQSYRNNYRRQVNHKPVPYWQAQSDYTTRGRMYNGYSDYSNVQSSYGSSNYYRGKR